MDEDDIYRIFSERTHDRLMGAVNRGLSLTDIGRVEAQLETILRKAAHRTAADLSRHAEATANLDRFLVEIEQRLASQKPGRDIVREVLSSLCPLFPVC
jgi:hypothetical protein